MLVRVAMLARSAMMDFGFGSFLDKFEARFGGKATTVLLILIAVCVASFCVNVTATYVVIPTIAVFQAIFGADIGLKYSVGDTVNVILSVILFSIVSAAVIGAFKDLRARKTIEQAASEYEEFLKAASEFWTDSSEYVDTLNRLEGDLEAARTASKRQELVAELRAKLRIRQADYATKIAKLNDSIRDLRN